MDGWDSPPIVPVSGGEALVMDEQLAGVRHYNPRAAIGKRVYTFHFSFISLALWS